MPAPITTEMVWRELDRRFFAVLATVSPSHAAHCSGIVYTTDGRLIYICVDRKSAKARDVAGNPLVSMTVTIPKGIPLMPFLPIPPATITFSGEAQLQELETLPPAVITRILRGLVIDDALKRRTVALRIRPTGHFVTYGVGVSLLTMRHPELARGRVAV